MRGAARIYAVRMELFVLKIEKLSQVIGPRESQDLTVSVPDYGYSYEMVCKTHVRQLTVSLAGLKLKQILTPTATSTMVV